MTDVEAPIPDPATVAIRAGALTLRPTAREDRAGIVAAGQAASIGGRMPWFPSPFPDHYADGWIDEAERRWRAGQHYVLSILADDGGYAGSVVISRTGEGGCELSYWVLPAFEGRGIATAASQAAMDWACAGLQTRRFIAKTRADNAASQCVLLKLGFSATGTPEAPTFALELAAPPA
jgi:[ribosomal protein S5]-alanine N-acetyltransferase